MFFGAKVKKGGFEGRVKYGGRKTRNYFAEYKGKKATIQRVEIVVGFIVNLLMTMNPNATKDALSALKGLIVSVENYPVFG